MKKSNIAIALILSVVMLVMSFSAAFAATASQKRDEANKAGAKADAASAKAYELEQQGYAIKSEIEKTEAAIAETTAKLEKKQKEVETQETALNDRLSVMYKTGSVGIVDVILSSESVQELVLNLGMVQKILKSDQEILKGLQDDYQEIDKLKKQQEEDQKTLETKKAEIDELTEQYKAEAEKYKAEEAKLKSEADELAKIAMEEANKHPSGGGAFSPSGTYAWPTASNYYFTSYYGYREHPIFGYWHYHSGYDIVLTSGTNGAPVYAAGDGVVTKASSYGGYGNCVMINIGNGYTTLYGHLSGYNCSYGQTVKKGQVVGYIGSTGNSTGPHLHFTLYKNGSLVDPMVLY